MFDQLHVKYSSKNQPWRLPLHIGYNEDNLDESISNQLDLEWFDKQAQYKTSLNIQDIVTLFGYTLAGDVIANNYLRGKLLKKFLIQVLIIAHNVRQTSMPK